MVLPENLVVNSLWEVKDLRDGRWHSAKIVGVRAKEVKVHYVGWKPTWDEWLQMDSPRLREPSLETLGSLEATSVLTASSTPVAAARGGSPRLEANLGGACALVSTSAGLEELVEDGLLQPQGISRECGFCGCELGEEKVVQCADCLSVFHSLPECVGLRRAVIDGILEDNKALSYHCIRCRGATDGSSLGPAGSTGRNSGAFEQLVVAVGALCAQVREICTRFDNFQKRDVSHPSVGGSGLVMQSQIRDEVREVEERRRRRQNVMLRGFGGSVDEAKVLFVNVCSALGLPQIQLTDVMPVGEVDGLFRAKIMDDTLRKSLLDEARRLKDIDGYGRVFVQKDLTFRQRGELKNRRDARAGGDVQMPSAFHTRQSRNVVPGEVHGSDAGGGQAFVAGGRGSAVAGGGQALVAGGRGSAVAGGSVAWGRGSVAGGGDAVVAGGPGSLNSRGRGGKRGRPPFRQGRGNRGAN